MIFITNISAAQEESHNAVFQQQLETADKLRTTNRQKFNQLLAELAVNKNSFSSQQKYYFNYLLGYQKLIAGELIQAVDLLDSVIQQQENMLLKHRAIVTKVNAYTSSENYHEGFLVLNQMLPMLEEMRDRDTFHNALFVVAMFYNRLSQYQVSNKYVSQLLNTFPTPRYSCLASMLGIEAKFRLDELTLADINDHIIEVCDNENEYIASGIIYSFIAQWHLKNQQTQMALKVLLENLTKVEKTQYYLLISGYYSLIAESYYQLKNYQQAEFYAKKVVDSIQAEHKSEAIVRASHILYLVNKHFENYQTALGYHELYLQHNKLVNDDKNKRNISYQISQKENREKTHQITLLDEKNKRLILEQDFLEQAADSRNLQLMLLSIIVLSLIYKAFQSYRIQNRLKNIADHDELTGVFNRRCFHELAGSALSYCNKTHQKVSLIMFDLDHFKSINDNYGHPVGDWALKKTIEVCQGLCRKNDIIGRFGGEEFTILLPGCGNKKAKELAEIYRQAIDDITTEEIELDFNISASFGVCSSEHGLTLDDVIKAADLAMYHAKEQGRNRVSVFGVDINERNLALNS
ncbi:GGDEF domain-containing protein [Colwelliaceae bacterium 6441]